MATLHDLATGSVSDRFVRGGRGDRYDTHDLATGSDGSFEVAEASRMETLRDLATGSVSDGSFEVAEASRMETLRDLASGSVSDGSFEVAEASRMETLRDLASGSVSDGSFEVAEASRMETLRDLASGSVSDGSFEVAEASRMETLRDLASGSVSDGSFEVAEASRMETLRDLATGSVSDGSFEVAEASRMATLHDLATGSVSDGSFEVAEANRIAHSTTLSDGFISMVRSRWPRQPDGDAARPGDGFGVFVGRRPWDVVGFGVVGRVHHVLGHEELTSITARARDWPRPERRSPSPRRVTPRSRSALRSVGCEPPISLSIRWATHYAIGAYRSVTAHSCPAHNHRLTDHGVLPLTFRRTVGGRGVPRALHNHRSHPERSERMRIPNRTFAANAAGHSE